jgi:hypothetical protein
VRRYFRFETKRNGSEKTFISFRFGVKRKNRKKNEAFWNAFLVIHIVPKTVLKKENLLQSLVYSR